MGKYGRGIEIDESVFAEQTIDGKQVKIWCLASLKEAQKKQEQFKSKIELRKP